MRGKLILLAGVCAGAISFPAYAQNVPADAAAAAATSEEAPIIVTAQRSNERLQDVPIAISAFSSEAIEKQQIKNTSDLQLTLPNVTFTKGNFTGSSFTIRGIGDLCVGVTCDSATAIHLNDAPLFATRLFETEFYDINQIEVLRGPQGTLFGRNATSGVVDFITAKPDMSKLGASAEGDYGNYNSMKAKGVINIPLTNTLAVRLAGFYLKRDGYTTNTLLNTKIDNRNEYSVRGSLRWEPTSDTTIDLMGQYFREQDSRMRSQKQACQTDPTGVLGCLNGTITNGVTNFNSTFVGVLTSKEFFATQGLPTALALGSLYGPNTFAGAVNSSDPRSVNTPYDPRYYTRETIIQGSIEQRFGGGLSLKVQGQYQNVAVDSSQDYNGSLQNRAVIQPALNTLAFLASGAGGAALATYLAPAAAALVPNGPGGVLCTSAPEPTGTGIHTGKSVCSPNILGFDRSDNFDTSYSAEGILSSKWDGPFNFQLGGIYAHFKNSENSYYVDGFGIDYFTSVVGALSALGAGLPPSYLGTPTYRNNTTNFSLNSYGIFAEGNYKFNDKIKLTVGVRYNHDQKTVTARTTLASFLVPNNASDTFASPFGAQFDADPATTCAKGSPVGAVGSVPGCEAFQVRSVSTGRVTGRAVLDFQLSRDHLLYVSYSRGYKSGGINPPLSPIFAVSDSFAPEAVDAFEVGSKNSFANGKMQLNLTGFYYKYSNLQLSRIVARTSVNDNVGANIYGAELEMILHPVREMTVNIGASYLNTSVSQDKFLANPRDFGAGRSDAVIIKDITNGANCAVAANTAGNVAGVNGFVNTANSLINAGAIPGLAAGAGLQGTTPFPAGGGINSTGAFSVCGVLTALAPTVGTSFGGVTVYSSGIPVNIRGNSLPGAPNYKASAGAQYEFAVGGGYSFTPRFDVILVGTAYGSIFNGNVNRIPSYMQVNAQIQFDAPDKRFFVRAYVQNITKENGITGQYVTDQSSGNYTNIFTLEPRRYGIAAGFKF